MRKALALVAVALVASACDDDKSVLDEGVRLGTSGESRVVGDAEAEAAGPRTLDVWRGELRRGARQRPNLRFDNLAPNELQRRLSEASRRYDFEVVSVQFLRPRPRQLAPKIVVGTSHYLALARATPAILRRLDPKRRTSDDRTGWRFEGFYFRAEDERGVPFLIVQNFWRGNGPGGGQWARSERLFPFSHG